MITCRAQKHCGSQIGQCSPVLVTTKAEKVDQSDASIPLAAAPEDTPALGKDGLHLTPLPSSLRQRSPPGNTRDEDLPESAWLSLDVPPEFDGVVLAVAPEGLASALAAQVPGSNVDALCRNGSANPSPSF